MNTVNELMNKRIHRCFCFYTAILFVRISREIERERGYRESSLKNDSLRSIRLKGRKKNVSKKLHMESEWWDLNPTQMMNWLVLSWSEKMPSAWGMNLTIFVL